MNNLGNLLTYLEGGDDIDNGWIVAMQRRAKPSGKKLYRTIILPDAKVGQPIELSAKSICSASSTPEASLAACKSFAHDNCKDCNGMVYVTLEIENPVVCFRHKAIKRYLEFFDNTGRTLRQVIPRLNDEQESIVCGVGHFGTVISVVSP